MRFSIGIDPGQKGGIAAIDSLGEVPTSTIKMPMVGKDFDIPTICNILNQFPPELTVVTIESVHSMPGQGVASTFSFGRGYGILIGASIALGFKTEFVPPQTWKKEVLLGTKKDKDAALSYVNRVYPENNIGRHDGMADAICLAEYGRRKFL